MDLLYIKNTLREKGVTGAGGGGFPSYAKLDAAIDTVIINGAECEPLFAADKYLLRTFPEKILPALDALVGALNAEKGIVAIKKTDVESAAALYAHLPRYPRLFIHGLDDFYPAGDEIVCVYETTGRVVPPGGVPAGVGAAVFNAETAFNIYQALFENKPVTRTWLTVAGAAGSPVVLCVPVGVPVSDVLNAAGIEIPYRHAVIMGGVMTGKLTELSAPVIKTTKALLILPENSETVQRQKRKMRIELKRAFSVCSQCRMCTDICPRALLGHGTAPHQLMRSVACGSAVHSATFTQSLYCSNCGLCEMYACHQGLSPRRMQMKFKSALATENIRGEAKKANIPPTAPLPFRNERRVPSGRLAARLGLSPYRGKNVCYKETPSFNEARIPLKPPAGALCAPTIADESWVEECQVIALPPENALGVPIHASIRGIVTIEDDMIYILAQ